ncbi:murein hydrolase activator EnvC [Desulfonatronum sp. SC1]|uniref:murein hydrolase activator EnvC family protein n=1 Tax=Desulfonatronum sp. SC1 TaxID=2109626 RepID=UPI001304BDDD|nr:peptidoglycan DD-metalloendopeptidase family protein [Desulfonatronum sp. SC1]
MTLLLPMCGPSLASPTTAGTIQRTLEERERNVRAHEKIMESLSAQERSLFADLQKVEARLRTLTDEISELEAQLNRLRQEERLRLQDYQELDLARTQTSEELGRLLALLWPVHLQGVEHNLQTLTSWDEADRQYHWLSRIYGLVQDRIDQLRRQGRELALGQARLEQAREEIAAQMLRIDAGKDQLLKQKLEFLHRVQEVRAQQISTEEQIEEILRSIAELNYQLQSLTSKSFTDLRGYLSWPTQARVVERFQPQANPPHRGISFAMSENDPVRAISWGKVVHSDTLRGYGHVVILYHGEDYYSLYAFLHNALVTVGQEVEKDEQIGVAGIYPKVDGPGLYFELRFHQNPVNPVSWLVANE